MSNSLIDASKIVDKMLPSKFCFNKNKSYDEIFLPVTKYNESYFLIKQHQYNASDVIGIHYYILNNKNMVIGRFDVRYIIGINGARINYHLISEFQNKGIGQVALAAVVENLFRDYNINQIRLCPVNERSVAIALKNGFIKKNESNYELNSLDYGENKSWKKGV